MRILALALGIPFPPVGGGLTRTFHLLRSLAPHHDVTLAAFTYGEQHEEPPYPLELRSIPWQFSSDYERMTGADVDASHRAFQHLTFESDEPWFASVVDPTAMNAVLHSETKAADLVLIEGTPLARFLPALPAGVPRVLDLFDIHSVMAQRAARSAPGDAALEREAQRTLAFERNAVGACDACLSVSEDDAAAARGLLGAGDVYVVPNGVDTAYFSPSVTAIDPEMVLFTGRMDYGPNIDAVHHFIADILPRIRTELPNVAFHVVGAQVPPDIAALAGEAVIVHGRVDDIRPFHHRAAVVVVPIRAGGGTRLKVLEAAACAKAIVSTSLGAEGLPLRHGNELLLADTSADFGAAVVTLLRNPALRSELGARARAATRGFDWSAIGESFRAIVEKLIRDRA